MACIVYRTNPQNGVTYAYQSESYRDPVTKKPKSRRTYLGRVDPETQMIIPKGEEGKRNRSKLGEPPVNGSMPVDTATVIANLRQEVDQLRKENVILREQLEKQKEKTEKANRFIYKIKNTLEDYLRE